MATKKETISPEQFSLGWLPDLPDARDLMYAAPMAVSLNLPKKVSLLSKCPPVYNQGMLGSCTANALGVAFEVCRKIQKKTTWRPSRLFLYYNERIMINTRFSDSGAFLRDGIKSLNSQGICKEADWTYDDNRSNGAKFTVTPPASCYNDALVNQVLSYQRLDNNINTLKGCLAEGFPFVFGFTVYDSFYNAEVRTKGLMPMPDLGKERVRGGHAIIAVGYDDAKQCFIIRNSWGKTWGDNGNFYMPYAYATGNLCDDFWTIRLVEAARAKRKTPAKKAVTKKQTVKKKAAPKKKAA